MLYALLLEGNENWKRASRKFLKPPTQFPWVSSGLVTRCMLGNHRFSCCVWPLVQLISFCFLNQYESEIMAEYLTLGLDNGQLHKA